MTANDGPSLSRPVPTAAPLRFFPSLVEENDPKTGRRKNHRPLGSDHSAAGRVTRSVVPRSSEVSKRIVPCWVSAISRAEYVPRPVPPS